MWPLWQREQIKGSTDPPLSLFHYTDKSFMFKQNSQNSKQEVKRFWSHCLRSCQVVKLNFSGQDQCGSYRIVYSGCSLFITGNCSHLWVVYPVSAQGQFQFFIIKKFILFLLESKMTQEDRLKTVTQLCVHSKSEEGDRETNEGRDARLSN